MSTLESPDQQPNRQPDSNVDPYEAQLTVGDRTAYKPVQVELQVPSGKLVISGIDFLNEYTDGGKDSPQYGSKCGHWAAQKSQLEAFAERGLIFGYMGNSVPTIFQDGNSIVLGENPEQESGNEAAFIKGEKVGSILTDASSYFIADHDDYVSKGGETDQYWEHQRPRIVDVEPGRYVVTHHFGFTSTHSDYDAGEPVVYVSLARSDEPISNPTYPEEMLESIVTSLFPNSRYYAIEVTKPFEEFEVKITFDQGAYTTATIPMDRVNDEAFVKEAVEAAWAANLEQREHFERVESALKLDLERMRDEEPERFAAIMEELKSFSSRF